MEYNSSMKITQTFDCMSSLTRAVAMEKLEERPNINIHSGCGQLSWLIWFNLRVRIIRAHFRRGQYKSKFYISLFIYNIYYSLLIGTIIALKNNVDEITLIIVNKPLKWRTWSCKSEVAKASPAAAFATALLTDKQ